MVVIYEDYKSLLQMPDHCELHILFITLKALQTFISISQTLLTTVLNTHNILNLNHESVLAYICS